MAWFFRDQRGPEWKQGWRTQTLSSISLPPFPLIAVFAIVLLFLSLSHYTQYKAHMEQTVMNFNLLLFFIPVALILIVKNHIPFNGRFSLGLPRAALRSVHSGGTQTGTGTGTFPWGVSLLLLLLLLMVSYKSSSDPQWFRPLWRSN